MKDKTTKPKQTVKAVEDMRAEYDFSKATRGKYYQRVMANSNVVVLDPDISSSFKNSKTVNEALRNLLKITRETAHLTTGSPRTRSKTAGNS